jgi:hypothetical protein
VSGEEAPEDAHVDQVNSKLTESLKTCRAMVSRYRTMLAPDQTGTPTSHNEDDGSDTGEELPPADE